jgi:hypothetical protein
MIFPALKPFSRRGKIFPGGAMVFASGKIVYRWEPRFTVARQRYSPENAFTGRIMVLPVFGYAFSRKTAFPSGKRLYRRDRVRIIDMEIRSAFVWQEGD